MVPVKFTNLGPLTLYVGNLRTETYKKKFNQFYRYHFPKRLVTESFSSLKRAFSSGWSVTRGVIFFAPLKPCTTNRIILYNIASYEKKIYFNRNDSIISNDVQLHFTSNSSFKWVFGTIKKDKRVAILIRIIGVFKK